MLEFSIIFLIALGLLIAARKLWRKDPELAKHIDAVSQLIAQINMYAVQRNMAGDKEIADMSAQIAQHLRDAVSSVKAETILHPETLQMQRQVLSRLVEQHSLVKQFMAGSDKWEAARTSISLRRIQGRLSQISRGIA